jgi:hypothetical protein
MKDPSEILIRFDDPSNLIVSRLMQLAKQWSARISTDSGTLNTVNA